MAAPNSNFDQALTTATWKYLTTNLVDNIFNKPNLLGAYKKMGAVSPVDGGTKLVIPLQYASGNFTGMAPWAELSIAETDEFTMAEYNWCQYGGSVALSDMDLARNAGETQVIDLVQAKLKNLENTSRQQINTDLFVGNASDPLKLQGLVQLVAATGTIGNIDSSAQTWWRSYVDSTAEVLDDADMETAFNTASREAGPVNLIITTQSLYEKYMDLVKGTIVTQKPNAMMAELGFDGVTFKGVPIVWDISCPAGYMFFLNTEYIGLKPHQMFNFKMSDRTEMPKQFVFAYKMILIAAHCISARRVHARLQAKTT